ncbi:MAG TPA: C4-dicarboxylate ABC transporter [Firmicutes bacterium]|nr:C4-dicarboxylate ABC transporter [Bacillota bacterium]
MFQAVLMVLFFLVIAFLMFTRKLPSLIALPLLAIGIALIGGVPLKGVDGDGNDIGLLTNIIEAGSTRLAAAFTAVIFGAWLGQVMEQTGIAQRIIKLAAELGGDRPFWIAFAILIALTILFTSMGGLGAVIMLGSIVLPILISVGISPLVSTGVFLFGMAGGLSVNVSNWAFFQETTGVPLETIRTFAFIIMALTLVAAVIFLLIELSRAKAKAYWADRAADDLPGKEVGFFALITPLLPLVLITIFNWPIIPSLLVGIVYGLAVTQKSWNSFINILTKSAFEGVRDGGPAVILMIGIGMVLNAVFHPQVSATIGPLLEKIVPKSPVSYFLFFTILAPLALYRGPLNLFGLGSGVAGLMIGLKLLPAPAVMSGLLAVERMQAIGDPTNTHNVWLAGYAEVDVNQITVKLLPYVWLLVAAGVLVATIMFI